MRFQEPERSEEGGRPKKPSHRKREPSTSSVSSPITHDSIKSASSYNTIEDAEWERRIREAIRQEDAERQAAEEQRNKLQLDAVERYKKALAQDISKVREQAEELKSILAVAFDPPLRPEQIQHYVQSQQSKSIGSELWDMINSVQQGAAAPHTEVFNQQDATTRSRPAGIFRRLTEKFKKSDNSAGLVVNDIGLPAALRQQQAVTGCASVTSITASYDGLQWKVFPVNLPMHWLIHRLNDEEKKAARNIGTVSDTPRTYAELPGQCRVAVEAWLRDFRGERDLFSWTLVYAHASRARISKGRRIAQRALLGSVVEREVDNVILVFRQMREGSDSRLDKTTTTAKTSGTDGAPEMLRPAPEMPSNTAASAPFAPISAVGSPGYPSIMHPPHDTTCSVCYPLSSPQYYSHIPPTPYGIPPSYGPYPTPTYIPFSPPYTGSASQYYGHQPSSITVNPPSHGASVPSSSRRSTTSAAPQSYPSAASYNVPYEASYSYPGHAVQLPGNHSSNSTAIPHQTSTTAISLTARPRRIRTKGVQSSSSRASGRSSRGSAKDKPSTRKAHSRTPIISMVEDYDSETSDARSRRPYRSPGWTVRDRLSLDRQSDGDNSSEEWSEVSVGLNDDELSHVMLQKFTTGPMIRTRSTSIDSGRYVRSP